MLAIDHILPPKFYLFASCMGSYPVGMYAAANPDRISKLFLASPAGIQRGPYPD